MINKPLAARKIFAGSWLRMFGPEISFLKNQGLESLRRRNYFPYFWTVKEGVEKCHLQLLFIGIAVVSSCTGTYQSSEMNSLMT